MTANICVPLQGSQSALTPIISTEPREAQGGQGVACPFGTAAYQGSSFCSFPPVKREDSLALALTSQGTQGEAEVERLGQLLW